MSVQMHIHFLYTIQTIMKSYFFVTLMTSPDLDTCAVLHKISDSRDLKLEKYDYKE